MSFSLDTLIEVANVVKMIEEEFGDMAVEDIIAVNDFFKSGKTIDNFRYQLGSVELPADSKLDVIDVVEEVASLAARYGGDMCGGGTCLIGNRPNRDFELTFRSDEAGREFHKHFYRTFGKRNIGNVVGPATIDCLEDLVEEFAS